LSNGEWYIDGNEGMFSPASYTHGNAMNKIEQGLGVRTWGNIYSRPYTWYTAVNWKLECVFDKPYTGFVYPGFDNSWLYAETSPWSHYLPHWSFTNTLTSAQISLYTTNLSQLGDLISNDYNKTDFNWDIKMKYGTQHPDSPLQRYYQVDIKIGIEHSRINTPISYMQ